MSRPVPPYVPAMSASAIVALAVAVGVTTGYVGTVIAILATAVVSAIAGHVYGRQAERRRVGNRLRYAGEDLAALQEENARLETDQAFARIAADAGVEDSDGLTRDWRWRS